MKIVFDLDGVLRNLYPILRRKFNLYSPQTYCAWDDDGKNIYDLVKKDYSILERAKPTKYIKTIQDYIAKQSIYDQSIEIWSYQPYSWVQYTCKWIEKYFPKFIAYWLTPKEKFKRLKDNKDYILIDDYPLHLNYHHRLWLIDQKYNQNVKCEIRIKTVDELRNKLLEVHNV